MKWFRRSIRTGSRLALFALALQFVLAFGHFHVNAAQAAQPDLVQLQVLTAEASSQAQQQPANHGDEQQSNEPCAICAVIALANTTLFAPPPLLVLPHAVELSCLTTDAEVVHSNSARVAFQPRAPPVS